MSFSQLGYPQFLSTTQTDRTGDLSVSCRSGSCERGAGQCAAPAAPAAVTSAPGMYAHPFTASQYGAFLPCSSADLALLSQMGAQYELKDSPGPHPLTFGPAAAPFYPYGHYQYGDPARIKSATRETTSTLKAWLQEHKKNPYPTKGEKIMLAIITKMTLTQVSTWFANARRRLKKENKVTWGRSAEDRDGRIFDSDNEETADKNEDEEIDLESIDIEENTGDHGNDDNYKLEETAAHEVMEKRQTVAPQTQNGLEKSACISKEEERLHDDNMCSPHSHQLPVCNRPKIWSLAETATCPDTAQKSCWPSSVPGRQTLSPLQHPAFLRGNGIYTCQTGKLHRPDWTTHPFLGQSSLSNMKSIIGLDRGHRHYSIKPDALRHASNRTTSSILVLDSDRSRDSPSPNGEARASRTLTGSYVQML